MTAFWQYTQRSGHHEKNTVPDPCVPLIGGSSQKCNAARAMLLSLADYYDIQTEIRLQAVASLVEPAVMVFIGIAVAGLIIAMALPFMNIAAALS